MELFSKRLAKIMKAAGHTAPTLHYAIRAQVYTIQSWLNGQSEPKARYILPICEACGCTPNDLFLDTYFEPKK